jgi:hypothetical protein
MIQNRNPKKRKKNKLVSTQSQQLNDLLAAQWYARALSERDAHHRFLHLADRIDGTESFSALSERIREAANDELRHIDICMIQARRFGSEELLPYKGFQPFFAEEVCELVTLFCVMETINAALLVSLRDALQDQDLRNSCQSILIDEVQHARIGWAALSLSTEQERARVWEQLPRIFRAAGLHKIDREDSVVLNEPEWGILDRQNRVGIFQETMDSVILPGFTQFGWSQPMSLQEILVTQ